MAFGFPFACLFKTWVLSYHKCNTCQAPSFVILAPMAKNKTILMCPPKYFDIEYEINPWMHQDDQPAEDTAASQWQKLYKIYTEQLGWHVELIEPIKGLPDMVFATDCCLIGDDKVMLSSFRYPE